jgi:hypothetical protein
MRKKVGKSGKTQTRTVGLMLKKLRPILSFFVVLIFLRFFIKLLNFYL